MCAKTVHAGIGQLHRGCTPQQVKAEQLEMDPSTPVPPPVPVPAQPQVPIFSIGAILLDEMTMPMTALGNRSEVPNTEESSISTLRSSRNIALLCQSLVKVLSEGPQTRDALASITGFARQRVCTVLSVYKALGLIRESQRRIINAHPGGGTRPNWKQGGAIEWNEPQVRMLQHICFYQRKLIEIRRQRRILRAEEARFLQLVKKRYQVSQNPDAKRPEVPVPSPVNMAVALAGEARPSLSPAAAAAAQRLFTYAAKPTGPMVPFNSAFVSIPRAPALSTIPLPAVMPPAPFSFTHPPLPATSVTIPVPVTAPAPAPSVEGPPSSPAVTPSCLFPTASEAPTPTGSTTPVCSPSAPATPTCSNAASAIALAVAGGDSAPMVVETQ
ncbi:hypothetical protein PAPYR_6280 [Paratrimastix pyriformis]|uniref:Uncharacterized protein n=1 Tax=Paratrimastix pyriformis TaxID=342808 RepID=A0ABQ8UFH3_9EUKA|nr:hypothetical protein PAPYR_6280 [Paratrimastix pyriformis]